MSWPPWNGSLAELAAFAESPLSDGMLGEWVEQQTVELADVPALAALFGKDDPHLQEAGVELATALLRSAGPGDRGAVRAALEPALASLVRPGMDPYVVEKLAFLLDEHPLPSVIAALARQHLERPANAGRRFIMRNRLPEGWKHLEHLYARLALAAGDTPTARDLAYLPVLEARYGTRGWQATRDAISRQADMRR